MSYLGDFKEDGDLYHKFTTRAFASGVPTVLAGSPVLSVYKDEGGAATEKTTAEAYFDLDVSHDSIVGWNNVRIDLSGDAFFATGADYAVVITTGTVGGVSVVGENLFTFSIENRSMGQPAGATLADDIAAIKTETALIYTGTVTNAQGSDVATDVAGMIDANSRVDVGSWLGSAVTLSTGNKPDVNVNEISDDSTSADNLELQYDTTGLTGDTFPATQAQVGNISTGAGGLSALISAFAKVGAEPETNTYTSTQEGDGVYHIVEDDGGNTDFYYQATVSAGGACTAFLWDGYVQSNADTVGVYYWNWATTTYKQITTLTGSNGTTVSEEVFTVPIGATGTGADVGKVRLRFLSTTSTAVATDKLLCEYSQSSQSVGYANGAIWIDTNLSNTNTTDFVDGTADNPVSTIAAANTLSASTKLNKFEVAPSSSITFAASQENQIFTGDNWTLALGGQSIEGTIFFGADITGTSTATVTRPHFHHCHLGAVTLGPSSLSNCGIGEDDGLFTGGSAGEYVFTDCYSLVAGSGTPDFTFAGLGAATGINNRRWAGGSAYTLDSDCTVSHEVLAGGGQTFTTAGANVEIRGICRSVTLTLTGAGTIQFVGVTGPVTISGAATSTVNLYGVSSLTDTSSGTTVTDNTVSNASINAEVDTALNTAIPGAPTADSINERLATMDDAYTATRGAYLDELAAANLPADVNTIKAKTDNLPSGVAKNVALSNFPFFMVDSSDDISGKTGLTVTAEISKDAETTFTTCTNSVVEKANGVYQIDLTATEMNADTITLKFTATDANQTTISIVTDA